MAAMTETAIKKRSENLEVRKQSRREVMATGSQLHVDPITGFLGFINPPTNGGPTAQQKLEIYKNGGPDPFLGFTPTNKLLFLKVLPKHWPNLTKALREMGDKGCDRNTLHAHMETDLAFRERIREIERENMDDLKSTIKKFSKRPKNFMDRMALGRLYDPESFDPARKVIVENRKSVDTKRASERLTSAREYVDAELVTARDAEIIKPAAAPQLDAPKKP